MLDSSSESVSDWFSNWWLNQSSNTATSTTTQEETTAAIQPPPPPPETTIFVPSTTSMTQISGNLRAILIMGFLLIPLITAWSVISEGEGDVTVVVVLSTLVFLVYASFAIGLWIVVSIILAMNAWKAIKSFLEKRNNSKEGVQKKTDLLLEHGGDILDNDDNEEEELKASSSGEQDGLRLRATP